LREQEFGYICGVALRVFGLTGGIGSGKSAVALHWRARGLPVVNADDLARVAVVPGSEALPQIVDYFGPDIVDGAGQLDRARLGSIVFSDAEARRILDGIVHPAVRKLASARFAEIAARGDALACYEVPLLYEVRLERTYTPVVVVDAPEAVRQVRLAARDGLDQRQIAARIAAQMPLSEKARRADYVIENDDSSAQLHERSDVVFDALCHALAIDPKRYPKPELS
jgi:dephospho-CoA kinase